MHGEMGVFKAGHVRDVLKVVGHAGGQEKNMIFSIGQVIFQQTYATCSRHLGH
jgi:L-ribulose-5-phosphate 3-epimerase UlaE